MTGQQTKATVFVLVNELKIEFLQQPRCNFQENIHFTSVTASKLAIDDFKLRSIRYVFCKISELHLISIHNWIETSPKWMISSSNSNA